MANVRIAVALLGAGATLLGACAAKQPGATASVEPAAIAPREQAAAAPQPAAAPASGQPAAARGKGDQASFPIQDALSTADARQKLNPSIQLLFGAQTAARGGQDLGEVRTSKKTNGFARDDKLACERAFLSAVLELQARAVKVGGNAVVGIVSNYNNVETSSDTVYACGTGFLMAGVAFKARIARIGQGPAVAAASAKAKR